MTMFRLCLLGPTGKIARVRRYWASTDEAALAMAREMLAEDPTLIGLQLWDGSRLVAEERKRAVAILRDRDQVRAARRSRRRPAGRSARTAGDDKDQ